MLCTVFCNKIECTNWKQILFSTFVTEQEKDTVNKQLTLFGNIVWLNKTFSFKDSYLTSSFMHKFCQILWVCFKGFCGGVCGGVWEGCFEAIGGPLTPLPNTPLKHPHSHPHKHTHKHPQFRHPHLLSETNSKLSNANKLTFCFGINIFQCSLNCSCLSFRGWQ